MRIPHDGCGELVTAEITGRHCGGPLAAENVTVEPGRGGRARRGTRVIAKLLRQRHR